MSDTRRDELDRLLGRALKEFVSEETPPHRVWANVRRRVQGRGPRRVSGLGYLRQLGVEVMALGSDLGATARIMLAPLLVSSAWEDGTQRLILAGRSTGPLNFSIHH
jgi:hypothetical protein